MAVRIGVLGAGGMGTAFATICDLLSLAGVR